MELKYSEHLKRCKILVVDDFPAMRKQVTQMLQNFGATQIVSAADGEEAVEAAMSTYFDIVFCDFNLGPGKDGQQILEELRHRKRLRPSNLYIMITAENTKDMVYNALEFMPDTYLTKPFTQQELEKRLERLIAGKFALAEVDAALESEDREAAIEACDAGIEKYPKRKLQFLKFKANLCLDMQRYPQALEIFSEVESVRPLDWATIGKAKALLAMSSYEEVKSILQPLAAAQTPFMEVYDLLRKAHEQTEDKMAARASVEAALKVSPKSASRQTVLAEMAEDAGDWGAAETARKKAMRLSEHSVHESPDIYLNYANALNTIANTMMRCDSKRFKESKQVLANARKKYDKEPVTVLRTQVAEAAAYRSNKDDSGAAHLLEKAESQYHSMHQQYGASLGADVGLEMAKEMIAAGRADDAHGILLQLAQDFPDDVDVGKRIDELAGEPLSKTGKRLAVQFNRQGKELFDSKSFTQAIELFGKARALYPKDVAINLNLVMAMYRESEASGDSHYLEQSKKQLSQMAEVDEQHPQFDLYRILRQKLLASDQ